MSMASAKDDNLLSPYRTLLLDLSSKLLTGDLEKLKFACKDAVPYGKTEEVTTGFKFFDILEQNGKISPQNLTPLENMMTAIGRLDLALEVKQFMIGNDVVPDEAQQDEMEALRQRNLQLAEREVAPGNNDRGVLGEEREPFPRLHEMESALFDIRRWEPPLPTMGSGLGGMQEQVEPITTPDLTSSPTRVPRFGGTLATVEREPLSYEAPSGEGSNETDFADGGPGVTEPLQTSPQVATLRSQLHLDRDGAFLDPKKYDPIKRLGSGGFAKVYVVRNKTTGKISACKMFDLGENDEHIQEKTKMVEQEVRILSALKHRFIVEFYHTDQGHNTFLIFMECMEGGSVEKLLKEKGPLKEPVVQKFTRQLLEAVDFLHNKPTNPVIHKDIKGGNILLDKPHENIKLADFGISTIMQELRTATGGNFTRTRASFYWASPELLTNKGFGRNTDIWSVGCTVIEMLTTKPPLMDPENENLDDTQRMFKIANFEVRPPNTCSSLAFRFIDQCLSTREKRPEASELLKTDNFVKVTV